MVSLSLLESLRAEPDDSGCAGTAGVISPPSVIASIDQGAKRHGIFG